MSDSPYYEEMRPPADLSPWIAALWQIRGAADSALPAHRVLPDGCADILVDVGAWSRSGGRIASASLVGPMTRALVAPLAPSADMFGIRFRPGVVGSLSAGNARDLQNLAVPLADAGLDLPVDIERLFVQTSLQDRAQLVLPWIRRRLADGPAPDRAVAAAIDAWTRAARADRPLLSVAQVACLGGVTERSLERRFSAWAGYAPAQFRRLTRFRAGLRAFAAGSQSWVQVALQCGYADQAHLSRDFREFASTTATGWASEAVVGIVQDPAIAAL